MTAPAPTISDLTDAYNEFITALSRLLYAILEALPDPYTWSAFDELTGIDQQSHVCQRRIALAESAIPPLQR